ncbi:Phospholipase D1, partial [Modicella reniformis]
MSHLNLPTLIQRVQQVQKTDPESLQTPIQETLPPAKKHEEPEEPEHRHHEHWYSSLFRRRDASESSSTEGIVPVHEVSGASAPVFLLKTDDKGRRPPPILFQLVKIAIVDSEVNPDISSRQIVFRIELQYGDVKWVIRRTLYEFYKLHLTLSAKHYPNMPRFPNQMSWALSMAKAGLGMETEHDKDTIIRENALARRKALQNYLLKVMQELNGTVAYELYEFLEISTLSLTKDMGWKGKEGYVEIKIFDTSKKLCGIPIGFSDYDKCWAILRDSYMAFCPDISSDECRDVFIFDQNFYVHHKEQILGLNLHHIEIGNNHRKIELKGEHNREMIEWMEYFDKMKASSPWVQEHPYGSFAPEREDAKVRYYVDGKDYFHAVSDAILAAKDEIYIADWWLSPELYLRRPPEKNKEFRLDQLLKRKADEGVKIYVVIYKEISLALTLDSAHTKNWLQNIHPNIQVQRHPDHISVTATQFWAHHEKICVIDCRLAFIGGLDLCFGRYDSRTHQLADYHPSGSGTIWPGQDYSNPRIKDFANVKDYNTDLIERKLLGRMPWHDVSIGVVGQPARDIARHFVQRWNFVKREKGMKKTHMKFLTPKGEFVSTRNETGWTGTQKVQVLRSSTTWSQGVDLEHSIQQAYLVNIEKAEHFIYIENQFFVTLAAEDGNPHLKNRIGISLVDRIVRAHTEGKKFRVIVVMPLMPAFEADIMSSEAGTLRKVMHFQYVSICRGGSSVLERLEANGIDDPDQYIGFYGLRSFDRIKHGKFDAIVEAVKEAESRITDAGLPNTPQQPTENGQDNQGVQAQSRAIEAPVVSVQGENGTNGSNIMTAQVGGEIVRLKSLAAKFLLDPIPRDKEAERIKAISERRKVFDMQRRWDESITKRVMTRSRKEHGYIPPTTERCLGNRKTNQDLRQDTAEAERVSKKNYYQGGTMENSEPHIIEGLGTMVRTAVNTLKGTKEQGDLEPKHHKISRHPLVHTNETSEVDPVGLDTVRSAIEQESGSRHDKEEAEEIVEPLPVGSTEVDGEASVSGSEGETTIEDNEMDDFVTEQLYIHSKLMIVDDRVGYRDSEIAIVIEDTDMVPSKMNGEDYQAGRIAHNLRTDLFKEHLGLLPHVEHDVVTRASLLPVDLDAPSKDPDQARKELIAKANAENQPNFNGSHGHLQVTMPDEEDIQAFDQWHAKIAQGQVKQAASQDPKTADQIVMDPLHDDFYVSWWKRVAKQNTEIFREVFR